MKRHEIWASFANRSLGKRELAILDQYLGWLDSEAIPAGGLGPDESTRLVDRHIGDALIFARFLRDSGNSVWDLGSGVGLPGIPLATVFPDREFVLVDRSGRRTDLARRAVRVLELENVQVIQGEIEKLEPGLGDVVSRAALPPDDAADIFRRLLGDDSLAIMGGSWRTPPTTTEWEVTAIDLAMLDQTVWILMMRNT